MYKIINNITGTSSNILRVVDSVHIPFDPANADYANFKAQINAGEAELQDADGIVMSSEEATAFVSSLA